MSAAPDFEESARLPCLATGHAGAGDDEGRGGGDVVAAGGVAAGADDVDGALGRLDAEHLRAHGGDRAGDLVHGLAAHAEADEERADLRRRRLAGHDDAEGLLGLLAGEALAGGDLADDGLQVGMSRHRCLGPLRRVPVGGEVEEVLEDLVAVLGGDAFGVELHAVDREGLVHARP